MTTTSTSDLRSLQVKVKGTGTFGLNRSEMRGLCWSSPRPAVLPCIMHTAGGAVRAPWLSSGGPRCFLPQTFLHHVVLRLLRHYKSWPDTLKHILTTFWQQRLPSLSVECQTSLRPDLSEIDGIHCSISLFNSCLTWVKVVCLWLKFIAILVARRSISIDCWDFIITCHQNSTGSSLQTIIR